MSDLLLTDVRVWGAGDAPRDVAVRGGRIAAIGSGLPADGAEVFDGTGCLIIPGLVDAHAHIDKTLWGTP